VKRATRVLSSVVGVVLASAALGGAGCMPPIRVTNAFSSRFRDNDRGRIQAVLARLPAGDSARPINAPGQGLVAGVVQGGERAVAVYDVATRRALWSRPMAASSTPEIVGEVVVVEVGGSTRLLDLRSGEERGRVDHNTLDFAGAAQDGDTVVLSFAAGLTGGSRRAGRVVAVDARSGSERWSHDIAGIVGRPAARGGVAFVPWDRQSIAVLDLSNGHEVARIRSTDDVLSWVSASADGVFYGGRGIYRLTPSSAEGTRVGSAYLANPLEGVPGEPQLYADAFFPTSGSRTARDKIRFGFRPRAGAEPGQPSLQHNAIFLAYFRHLVALDAASGAVRWAVRLDEDVEAMQVTTAGVFVVSGTGVVRSVDPTTGAVGTVSELGAQIGGMQLDLEGLALGPNGTAPEGGVREQLVALVRDADNRLVPFRSFLVGILGRLEAEEVTRDLLDLYTQRSIPGQLRQSVATALQARRTGASYLVTALNDHYDYLENRQAPPLQVIAPTLVAMNAREATQGLLAHLLDHETPMSSLPAVVNAVATLGEASVVATLQRWVMQYKSDSAFRGQDNAAALQAALDAILHHGDAGARQWLEQLQANATASPALRTHIEGLFARETRDASSRAAAATESERQAQLQAALNTLREAQSAVPATLSDEAINGVWSEHLDDIRACAQGAVTRNPTLNQIRVVITLRSDVPRTLLQPNPPTRTPGVGEAPSHPTTVDEAMQWVQTQQEGITAQRARVRLTTYAPSDAALRQCMDAVLMPLEFPAFRDGRQEFRRVIDTRAARTVDAESDRYSGLGVDTQGRELPWWLVSAPSLEVEQPTPATPATRPGTGTTATPGTRPGTPTGTPPGTPTGSNPATPPGTPTGTTPGGARPWWEE